MGARERLVYSTIELLRRHGVAGTGIADILEGGRVSRRSVYLHFPDGKTALVSEAASVAGDFIDHQIARLIELPSPREALATFIDEWKSVVAESGFTAGCPIAAAGLSRASTPEVSDLAGEMFQRWQVTMSESLLGHGVGEEAAPMLANTILAAVEGAVALSIAQKSLTVLDDIEAQLSILIDYHLADGSCS